MARHAEPREASKGICTSVCILRPAQDDGIRAMGLSVFIGVICGEPDRMNSNTEFRVFGVFRGGSGGCAVVKTVRCFSSVPLRLRG